MSPMNPATILGADWGKAAHKRAVWAADVHGRPCVRRLYRAAWTLPLLLEEAERLVRSDPVLVVLDVPLGVPQGYLAAVNREAGLGATPTFIDLLTWTMTVPCFFNPTTDPRDWSLVRPFFVVAAGEGGRTAFDSAAAQLGCRLCFGRSISKRTPTGSSSLPAYPAPSAALHAISGCLCERYSLVPVRSPCGRSRAALRSSTRRR